MISTKTYDKAIKEAEDNLRNIYKESVHFAEDYKKTSDRVKQVCLSLLELTWKFQGQEEL